MSIRSVTELFFVFQKFDELITMTNLYHILELEKGASDLEIKKAYRRMAKIYYPDCGGEFVRAKEFRRIHIAYSILSDPEKRKYYDPMLDNNDAEEFLDDWKQEAIDEYQRIEEMSCEDFVNRGIKLYMYSVEPKKEKRFVIMMIISTLLGYAGLVTYYWYPYDDIFSVNMFWTGLILSVVFSSLSFFYISIYRSNKKIME